MKKKQHVALASESNGQSEQTRPGAPQPQLPVVVTLVYDPSTGAIAVTPSFSTPYKLLLEVLHVAQEQIIAFAAVQQHNALHKGAPLVSEKQQ